jgi:pimeloyl-ACP methyl ester carboxylesterase
MDRLIVFGDADNLFGIATVPAELRSKTAVMMLTAGMLHHVGSFRFHVSLARKLEKVGLLSFRFDLSGIGESLAIGSSGSSLDRASTETGRAMDRLATDYGIEKIILFGLCSGADDGWHVAKHDTRIVGLAMLDGLGYPTKMHQRLIWLERARKLSWPSYWGARLRRKQSEVFEEAKGLPVGEDIREFPSREVAAQDLKGFIERNLRILACYTGGSKEYYNYEGQFAEMFFDVPLAKNVEHEFFPNMDHVTLLKEDRRYLLGRFASWCEAVALEETESAVKESQSQLNVPIHNAV